MAISKPATDVPFAEQFEKFAAGEENALLRRIRENAFEAFARDGFPTPRNEEWKYTNVAPFVDPDWSVSGRYGGQLQEREVEPLKEFDTKRSGFASLNAAFGEYEVMRITRTAKLDEEIEWHLEAVDGEAHFPHTVIVVEAGIDATIVETFSSAGKSFTNSVTRIIVEENASLIHYRVQKESSDAVHIGLTEVVVNANSRYNGTNINIGAALSRHDIDLKFLAEGGEAWVDGLYMLNGSQHSDTHSVIDHTVPNCTSHQNYKGVLNDKSRGVFNGKVFVRENAHGTDAQQSNKNLLLSDHARVDTKPQLEIFNDDVKCSHGATVGQLEEEELFYLLTRGLPETLARNLLTYGFAEEIISKIAIESIKSELDQAVLNRLSVSIDH